MMIDGSFGAETEPQCLDLDDALQLAPGDFMLCAVCYMPGILY